MNNYWTKYHDAFHEGYTNASEAVKKFIDSEEFIKKSVETLCINNRSLQGLKKSLVNIYIYKALNLISDEEILSYLASNNTDAGLSNLILSEVSESIAKLETTELNDRIETTQEILEAEAELETISPIRTMSNDSIAVTPKEETYTSMQSAILGEGK